MNPPLDDNLRRMKTAAARNGQDGRGGQDRQEGLDAFDW
jgi:hypothetical protein